MGAHSVDGHPPVRTVTAAVGVAAALVTTATTGLLTGGTALATDGSDGPGHGHSHRHHQVDQDYSGDDQDGQDAQGAFASQALCDVLGDVPLGVGVSCPSGPDDSSGQGGDTAATSTAATHSASAPTSGAQPASAPKPPAPAPKPTSAVPAQPQLLKIG